VLAIAFSFADPWLGVLIGLGILSTIPVRRIYPLIRRYTRRTEK
jgi:hypothetical protein